MQLTAYQLEFEDLDGEIIKGSSLEKLIIDKPYS